MKLFIAGLATETNSFSPMPTGRRSFEEGQLTRKATQQAANMFSAPLHVWRRMAEEKGWSVTESISAFAQPSGPTVRLVYEELRDEILDDLRAAGPFDVVLLSMHGAMIAHGYDDCEGDTLARVREIVGADCVIGLEIDPHSHLTEAMLANADLIICYKEYPHTDTAERAAELFQLAEDTAAGRINPVMRYHDCRMISMYLTPDQPMRGFVEAMMAREGQGGLLSLSLAHGFPWGDVAEVGTRMLAIADGNEALAADAAREFGERLWSMREDVRIRFPDMSTALDRAEASSAGPVVLGDFADNAGGGAPADSTFVLSEVIRRGLRDVAIGIFWDPGVVRMCMEAGEGAELSVRLGGKVSPASGEPVDLDVTVSRLASGHVQHLGASAMTLGECALLESNGIHLLVNDKRTQLFHPEAFTDLGLDLSKMKIIVVKSSQHFYAGFAPIAVDVIRMATPGAMPPDFTIIPYTKRHLNYWPVVEDPFAN